ncbi:MAG: hypothetical protein IJK28_07205 [Clostridia bacterium]|nr:hypothetical protein [Clostridia bacterium]
MLKRWMTVILAVIIALCCVPCRHAEAEGGNTVTSPAIETLRGWGFTLDDATLNKAAAQLEPGTDILSLDAASLLLLLGFGIYDDQTDAWEPVSHDVYLIDAEMPFIDRMYTNILTGIDAIVPDIEITDIAEDLSGMTAEMVPGEMGRLTDGKRTVSFLCNGHPYSTELTSYGDWVNEAFFDFMDNVLEQENCPHKLYQILFYYQYVVMVYGPEELAVKVNSILSPF